MTTIGSSDLGLLIVRPLLRLGGEWNLRISSWRTASQWVCKGRRELPRNFQRSVAYCSSLIVGDGFTFCEKTAFAARNLKHCAPSSVTHRQSAGRGLHMFESSSSSREWTPQPPRVIGVATNAWMPIPWPGAVPNNTVLFFYKFVLANS